MTAQATKKDDRAVSLPLFGIPRIFPYVRQYVPRIIAMIVMGVLSSVADSAYPLFNRYALDNFVARGTLEGLRAFILLYIGMLALQTIDNFITCYWCGHVEMSVDRDLRNAAFDHLQTLSFSKSSCMRRSMTSVLMALAPVMPSLRSPVIVELISRMRRFSSISFLWKKMMSTTATGTSARIYSARRQFMDSITTSTHTMYEPFQMMSMRRHATMTPILPVSDITRAWI